MLVDLYLISKDKRNLKSSSDKEESDDPDHDEDRDQLEEKQVKETAEMTGITTNNVSSILHNFLKVKAYNKIPPSSLELRLFDCSCYYL